MLAVTDVFPTADQVRTYLHAYADRFQVIPHLRLSSEVTLVSRSSDRDRDAGRFRVAVRGPGDLADEEVLGFDFVLVCNGIFSEPALPEIEGRELFAGSLIHSSQYGDPDLVRNRHVVVLGAGKSALDCAASAARHGASCTLPCRTPHWMLPRYLFGVRMDRLFFTRFAEMLLPPYHKPTRAEAFLHGQGAFLLRIWWGLQNWLIPRLCGMPAVMVPEAPLPSGIETIGIGDEFYRVLRQGPVEVRRAGIARFSGPRALKLETDEEVKVDALICATGWRQDISFLAPDLRAEVHADGRFRLYRRILPPAEPHLGFIGYASSSACPLTSELAAHWLSQCFRGELDLPDRGEMEREIDRALAWLETVFPRRSEGYFIGAYIAHYADELMRDMALRRHRAGNPISEHLGPFWPERYSDLASERREARQLGRR